MGLSERGRLGGGWVLDFDIWRVEESEGGVDEDEGEDAEALETVEEEEEESEEEQ